MNSKPTLVGHIGAVTGAAISVRQSPSVASGIAIIATPAGGNPEFLNDENGMLVRYNDRTQITSAIIKLLDDAALRQRLGEQARQTVQQFTLENFVNDNIRIIKDA